MRFLFGGLMFDCTGNSWMNKVPAGAVLWAWVLAVSASVMAVGPLYAQGNQITMALQSLTAEPGDTVELVLSVTNALHFYYAGMEVTYEPVRMQPVAVVPVNLSSPGISVFDSVAAGRIGASVSRTDTLHAPASGAFAAVRFRIHPEAPPGQTIITLPLIELYDATGAPVSVTLPAQTTLEITEPEPEYEYIPWNHVLASWPFEASGMRVFQSVPANDGLEMSIQGAVVSGFVSGYVGQAANSTGWHDAGDGSKFWSVTLSTEGFTEVRITSRQQASGSGPRDFLILASVPASDWVRITPDTLRLSSSSWVGGSVVNLALPEVFWNQPSVEIRWVHVSDVRVDGAVPVSASGTSRLDEVAVTGTRISPEWVTVWPGDTDNNGVVNADDVLPLGVHWLRRGPMPLAESTGFAPRPAERWLPDAATWADTNGDGVVDYRDLQWVGMHFGKTYSVGKQMNTAPLAVLKLHDLYPGDRFTVVLEASEPVLLMGFAWKMELSGTENADWQLLGQRPGHWAGDNADQDKLLQFLIRREGEAGFPEGAMVLKGKPVAADYTETQELGFFEFELGEGGAPDLDIALTRLTLADAAGNTPDPGAVTLRVLEPVSAPPAAFIPAQVHLHQNYPNPFNPATTIRFTVPDPGDVRLEVFDMIGRRVAVLINGRTETGTHEARFDAGGLSSGVYMYRLTVEGRAEPDRTVMKKMMLIK